MSTNLTVRIPSLDGRAACAGVDPNTFFPEPGGNTTAARAKAICDNCPVRAACLQWAKAEKEEGIWGGTTQEEREGRTPAENKPRLQAPINHGGEAGAVAHRRRGEDPCRDCMEGARREWRLRRDRRRLARLAQNAG